ncbi:MAG: AAA family ATPase [Planctomycetaceae bacterium]|nr:AAA family ATPase [Planctomycetaceae bacterium]
MLKSLELFGFKSFADKTVFEFHEGITGVVGPNGSGKSNVVDSIKWLLGDQSAKSLRGKEMTDVIFNGSSSRGSAQFAEATLTFDNTTRFLPLDYDIVSVGRRLWKSGDSEYLINGNTARLKDVRELLMGTGAGAASYCIIEQGRVDQILQSNAANRRLIFEEAAGISRFKQRRNEAERRLDRVEQNLLRLTDIVQEVESQVSSIRGQAKKATRYRDLSTQLERFWVGMVADDFRRQSLLRVELQQQKEEASATLSAMRERQELAESQLAEADRALAAVDDELREVERSRAELRSRMASLDTTLRHHVARESELQSEGVRLQRQLVVMDGRVAEAEKEEAHLNSVLNLEQSRFDERQAEQTQITAQLHDLHESLDHAQAVIHERRQHLIISSQESSDLATRLAGLRHNSDSLKLRQTELSESRQNVCRETDQLRLALEEHNAQVQEAAVRLKAAEEEADVIHGDRQGLLSRETQSRESLAELREQRSAAVARKTVLEDLEDRQEGFGIGVREILRRAEEGALQPWNLIRGSVADLLDVDMENAALLEVALSGRAQLLVIDRLQPLVEYLNSGRSQIAGRVGFVSLEDAQHVRIRQEGRLPEDSDEQRTGKRFERHGWSGDLGLGMFDRDWLDSDLTKSVSDEFVPELKVTWLDDNGEIPPARSVFSLDGSSISSLAGQSGVIGRADSLARSPRHLPGLAAQLLADTWVVQSLDDALRLQKTYGIDYRFVTLQGELVEKDGTLFTGNVRSESAVVSRKSELRRLKNELNRIEHAISERELNLQKLGQSIEEVDSVLKAGRDAVKTCSAELRQQQQKQSELQQSVQTGENTEDRLSEQLAQFEQQQDHLQTQLDQGTEQLNAAEQETAKLQQLITESEQSLASDRRQIDVLEKQKTQASLELTRTEERLLAIREALQRLEDDIEQRRLQQQEADRRHTIGQQRQQELNLGRLNVAAEMAELSVLDDGLGGEVRRRSEARDLLRQRRLEATAAEQQAREICRQHETQFHEVELKITSIDHQLETSAERIRDEFQISVEDAVDAGRSAVVEWLAEQSADESATDAAEEDSSGIVVEISVDDPQVQQILMSDERYEELRHSVDERVGRLRRQLKKLGNVGTESLDNLNELETRFERLNSQLLDLEAARDTLREMVRQINVESQRMFVESFECVRGHFRELFRRLFGGGEADVILEDAEDVLECAIDVVARPPGKELRSISLLSGGEKTMTAVALLLSIFKSRPSPFCILDEVDAALDDANIGRFVGVLKDFQQDTQFIMITHRKPTMAVTDVLYGVTMEESGISKRLVVRFEEIDDKGNFVPRSDDQSRAA